MYIMHVVFSVPSHHHTITLVVFPVVEDSCSSNTIRLCVRREGKVTEHVSFKRVWKDSVVAYIHFSSLRVELATEIMCRRFPDSCS